MVTARIPVPEAAIGEFCRRHGIGKLSLFGSVLTDRFSDASDVDILVDVVADAQGFAYFGLLEDLRRALTDVIGYDVDIVDSAGLRDTRERVAEEAVPL